MSQSLKCLELLDTKLWLIEFELENTDVLELSDKWFELKADFAHISLLRSKLIQRCADILS